MLTRGQTGHLVHPATVEGLLVPPNQAENSGTLEPLEDLPSTVPRSMVVGDDEVHACSKMECEM
jgi:hypothetical protein